MSICYSTASSTVSTDECGKPIEPYHVLSNIDRNQQTSELNKTYTNKFLMVMDIPSIVKRRGELTQRQCSVVNTDKLRYSVFGTTVPTITLPAISVPFSGHKLKVASHSRELEPMQVNYFVDNTFDNYWVLFKWADYIVSALKGFAGFDSSAPITDEVRRHYNVLLNDYSTTISVIGMDTYNQPMIEWIYKGCVITSVGGVTYNYQTTTEITSSFSFDYSFLDCVLR